MALRPQINLEASRKVLDRIGKLLGRIYVLWLLGIAIGTLKLKAVSISMSGASFTLEKPELVEGILYVGCLCLYLAMLYAIYINPYASITSVRKRQAIYSAVEKRGKTLKGKTTDERAHIKSQARNTYRVLLWIGMFGVFLPLVHILIFRAGVLWSALKAILS